LPTPQLPRETTASMVTIPHGANWMPAKEIRPTVGLQGRARDNMMPHASALNIGTEGKLDQYITAAHISGSWAMYSNMHTYVQEAHLLPKAQSPMQNAALVKWKTPNWVPAEVRPPTRQSNPNTPVGINTPQTTDPPKEWARWLWLWKYPREAATHPGILRAWYGINLCGRVSWPAHQLSLS